MSSNIKNAGPVSSITKIISTTGLHTTHQAMGAGVPVADTYSNWLKRFGKKLQLQLQMHDKQSLLSLDMKTKVVQYVHLSQGSALPIPPFSIWNFQITAGSKWEGADKCSVRVF